MILLYALIFLPVLLIVYIKWNISYWSRRNIKGPSPLPFVGNYLQYFLMRKHYGLINDDIYRNYPKAGYVGIYRFGNPVILLRDLDLVKSVLVENFNHFYDNDFIVDEKYDPLLAKSPFFSMGPLWRVHRSQTSPVFTASKLKSIFPSVRATGQRFLDFLNSEINTSSGKEYEVKSLFFKYTIENVASCLFSLEAEAFTNENSNFSVYSRKLFDTTFWQSLITAISVHVPSVKKIVKVPLLPKITDEWFRSICQQILKKRKAGERRNDFLQYLLDSRDKLKEPYTDDDVIGHCFTFLTEGFETSSITLAYCLFDLACHPPVQEHLRNEINQVLIDNNGQFTDECFQAIPYFDQVILESMRMHSAVFALSKLCTKPFKLPPQYAGDGNGVTIETGTSVVIPIHSIYRDPHIYRNPTIFDPERFNQLEMDKRHKYAFLGFGEGPRMCIGMKFALMQVKMALATVITNFNVKLSPATKIPLDISAKAFLLHSENGIWINFQKRSK